MEILLIVLNIFTIVCGGRTMMNGFNIEDGSGPLFITLGFIFVLLGAGLLIFNISTF